VEERRRGTAVDKAWRRRGEASRRRAPDRSAGRSTRRKDKGGRGLMRIGAVGYGPSQWELGRLR